MDLYLPITRMGVSPSILMTRQKCSGFANSKMLMKVSPGGRKRKSWWKIPLLKLPALLRQLLILVPVQTEISPTAILKLVLKERKNALMSMPIQMMMPWVCFAGENYQRARISGFGPRCNVTGSMLRKMKRLSGAGCGYSMSEGWKRKLFALFFSSFMDSLHSLLFGFAERQEHSCFAG